jgi:hypothetical protein
VSAKVDAGASLVGIDLGTTNTVLAHADAAGGPVATFDIPQLTAPGEIGSAPLLPSARYHPLAAELQAGSLQLPWRQEDNPDPGGLPLVAIGRLARALGARTPGRLVVSAKSWLSHAGVDRTAPILPWGAPDEVPKVSPLAASASYLAHLRAAWNARHPDRPLEHQRIVLTIPASFDEGARALTVEAARLAGLPRVRLLEEPQAALYDWMHRHRATLADDLAGEGGPARLVLVADVGGGTTDFSLVQVALGDDGTPHLTRIGVGNHLILGGDNMDLALAHLVESKLGQPEGQRLSAARLAQLTERCRAAKEQLLAPDAPDGVGVTLLGDGARLVGASRTVPLSRLDVERIVLDGFFPFNAEQEGPQRTRAGLQAFGLPYASDAAITRHLAGFLRQHAPAARAALGLPEDDPRLPVPDTLLLNGGVFRGAALAQRLADVLSGWRAQHGEPPIKVLHNADPDVAVARGAVAYSLADLGRAPVIASGSARGYYLLLDGGLEGRLHAVCLLPRGARAGEETLLVERSFALRLERPVRFHLVSSVSDPGGRPALPGDLVDLDPLDVVRLPVIATVLRAHDGGVKDGGAKAGARGATVAVQLAATLSDVGTLAVYCVAEDDAARRWQLEFQLRAQDGDAAGDAAASDAPPPQVEEAVRRIDRIFGARNQQVDAREVRQLRATLEHLLGGRERWETPLLRRLFDALMERAKGRRRSAEHERVWLNLAGWCLRPGFGDPLDGWRIEQLWALFPAGVQYQKDSQVRAEWWTLWRRVAGGLVVEAQLRLLDDFAFNLQAEPGERARRPVTLVDGSEDDMLRLGASLERIPAAYKAEIGDWMVGRIMAIPPAPKPDPKAAATYARYLWALARVGARIPLYGSAHEVAPPEAAARWLRELLRLDWKRIEPAGFAAAHIARRTGDRSRDIEDPLRDELLRRFAASNAPAGWAAMVAEVVELDQASTTRMYGDALPPGLTLLK